MSSAIKLPGAISTAHLLEARRVTKAAGPIVLDVLARAKGVGTVIALVAERPNVVVQEGGNRGGVAIVLPVRALAVSLPGSQCQSLWLHGKMSLRRTGKRWCNPPRLPRSLLCRPRRSNSLVSVRYRFCHHFQLNKGCQRCTYSKRHRPTAALDGKHRRSWRFHTR